MIGDHHQLPPVIKNMAFQKYSNMEQSLFTRLVRLGVPTVDLDGQGRARSSICSLYRWRYKKLSDLQHIFKQDEYKRANTGMVYDYQLINVEDFKGVGESEPNPFFYQVRGFIKLHFYGLLMSRFIFIRIWPKRNTLLRYICTCVCRAIRRLRYRY